VNAAVLAAAPLATALATATVIACAAGPSVADPPLLPAPRRPASCALQRRDLAGWSGAVEGYEVKEGAIVCKPGQGGTLFTTGRYRNFVVRLEFKLPPAGNNGLAIRYPGSGDSAYVGMTELQVLDDTAPQYATLDPRQAHGSAYGMVASTRGHLKPVGEWNEQEVTVRGSTIKVVLNGAVILDTDLATVTTFMADTPHPGKDLKMGHGFAGHQDPVRTATSASASS
jgi:hypothetical protein